MTNVKIDSIAYLTQQTIENLKILLSDAEEEKKYNEAKEILKEMYRCYLLLEQVEECKQKIKTSKMSSDLSNFLHVNLGELEYFNQDFDKIKESVINRHGLKIIK